VATNLPAYQSSVFDSAVFDFSARKAVDGTRTRDNNSCVLSNHETNPWWTVDLGIPLTITGVIFTNNANAGTRKTGIFVSSSYIYTIIKTESVRDGSSVGDWLALHGKQT